MMALYVLETSACARWALLLRELTRLGTDCRAQRPELK
jgi:hypothetical protein